ncbi:MAG: radical SAM protein [Bacteroidetes bacterium]|nr:MAG: radical SAM protein [Bacteroidota bacterium]
MTLHDTINIISKLSLKRLWNLVLLQVSYVVALFTEKKTHWGMPISISVEPTTSCNLRCPECPSGLRQFSRNTGMLGLDLYKKIIDQLGDKLMYMILYFQGEPFLNPEFFGFVELAHRKRIYTATSTNAHFLTDENCRKSIGSGLDRLIISLDGIGQEAYSSYRIGGRYDRVIEGIENIVKWKKQLKSKTPHVIVQFLVLKTNEHQMDDIRKLCNDLGVDELQFKTAQINDYENGSPLITTIDKYSRYRQKADGSWEFKSKLPNKCYRMWSGCVISWDGLIVPCCFDKDAKYRLGELKDKSFKEIWKSEKYNNFRRKVFAKRAQIDICRNCSEGMKL